MVDLFAPKQPKRSVGYGNAMFLCDLAEGVSDATMRANYLNGGYPSLHSASIVGWRTLAGRTTQTRSTGTTGEI